jgi:hypothetical protein
MRKGEESSPILERSSDLIEETDFGNFRPKSQKVSFVSDHIG